MSFGNFKKYLYSFQQKRRLDLITIGSLDSTKQNERRRVIAIMARVHPGEAPSSFVCQGILELLISSHPVASTLREHVIFKIIPMLNPDGVFLGNYRGDLMGVDLNRSWHIANPWSHPTLHAVVEMLTSIDRSKVNCQCVGVKPSNNEFICRISSQISLLTYTHILL